MHVIVFTSALPTNNFALQATVLSELAQYLIAVATIAKDSKIGKLVKMGCIKVFSIRRY